jgi:hypothetical protein
MKTNITHYGFTEISGPGLRELNGGSIAVAIVGGIVSAVCLAVFTDWDNFKNGLLGVPESKS